MSEMHVLLVHGLSGPGPWHWQQWLAGRLRESGVGVDLPVLPRPDRPALESWLPALRARLAAVPDGAELVVAAHSWGAALWLHHAASMIAGARRADRVLLVAPPAPECDHQDVRKLTPYPLDAHALRDAAGSTRVVAGTGDPDLPVSTAHAVADALHLELDVVPDGEDFGVEAGYGPWPAVLRWALHGTTPLTDRFDAEPHTAGVSPAALRLV